jgi:hypothetical protein
MGFNVFADAIAVKFGRENKNENADQDQQPYKKNIVHFECLPLCV